MDVDCKLKKLAQPFTIFMLCMQESPKTLLWLVLSDVICLISSSYQVKALSISYSTELTLPS